MDKAGTEGKGKRSRMQEGGGDAANETERVLGWAEGSELNGGGCRYPQNRMDSGQVMVWRGEGTGMWSEGDGDRSGDGDGQRRAGTRGVSLDGFP